MIDSHPSWATEVVTAGVEGRGAEGTIEGVEGTITAPPPAFDPVDVEVVTPAKSPLASPEAVAEPSEATSPRTEAPVCRLEEALGRPPSPTEVTEPEPWDVDPKTVWAWEDPAVEIRAAEVGTTYPTVWVWAEDEAPGAEADPLVEAVVKAAWSCREAVEAPAPDVVAPGALTLPNPEAVVP